MPWIDVTAADSIPENGKTTFQLQGLPITVCHVEGEFFAVDDLCPHQGASLGEGVLHDGRLICPWHNWVFDVRTGACPRNSHEPVDAYPTRVREGRVEVNLPEA